jgi:hypothetical protein
MEHGTGVPRYYNYGGQAHFTWSCQWTPRGQSNIYLRYDYVAPEQQYVSTWISDVSFRIDSLTMDGVTETFERFCEIPDLTYAGKRLLAHQGTRLLEMTTRIVLEREED